jgi:hypothetical protein
VSGELMLGRAVFSVVMAGLDPAIHQFLEPIKQGVDARRKAGHDEVAGGARAS